MCRQWVVQRRPSSRPASPSTNAAVQWAKIRRPAVVRRPDRRGHLGRGVAEAALGDDADQVGIVELLEAVLDDQVEPDAPRTRPGRGVHTTKSKTGLSSSGW